MKKLMVMMLVAAVFSGAGTLCLAQSVDVSAKELAQPRRPMMPGMRGAMVRSMVATSDGGVVAVIGEKLVKYDKDLNVVKEIEIKAE